MGCSVSRHMMIEVVSHKVGSPLSLDGPRSSSRRRKTNGGVHHDINNLHSNNINSTRQPVAKQPSIKRPRNQLLESRSERNDVSRSRVIIARLPPPEQTRKQEEQQQRQQQSEEEEAREQQEPRQEAVRRLSEAAATRSSGQSTVCVPVHANSTFPATTWTKTACCGMQCQNPNSRFCCEHSSNNDNDDEHATVSNYCPTCRERYQYWQEANQAFEDILCELEQRQRQQQPQANNTTRTSALASDLLEQEDDVGSGEGGTELWAAGSTTTSSSEDDDDTTTSGESNIYHRATNNSKSNHDRNPPKLPLCGNDEGHDDGGDDTIPSRLSAGSQQQQQQQQHFNTETQTGRYEVMCNSPSKDRTATKSCVRFPSSSSSATTLSWRPANTTTRYLYLLRNNPIRLSSLSLGDDSLSESVTGSMHSF